MKRGKSSETGFNLTEIKPPTDVYVSPIDSGELVSCGQLNSMSAN